MSVASVTFEELSAWPVKYQGLWASVNAARDGLWQRNVDQWVDDQILQACDEVAEFIRAELV